MKKALSIVVCLSLLTVIVFTACTKQDTEIESEDTSNKGIESEDTSNGETEGENTGSKAMENEDTGDTESGLEIVGGWAKADSPVITDEFRLVFEKAVSELEGVDYTPVAYLSGQLVAGTNHRILCKATPVVPGANTTYAIVTIYENLEGNAEITEVLSSNADAGSTEGVIDGGWAETESPEMTDKAEAALEKACETLTGAVYTPVALLATQVVAGMNYRIICESRPSIPSPERGYVIVTVYADLEGGAEIIDTFEF